MATIRRVYIYLLTGAGLVFLWIGTANLCVIMLKFAFGTAFAQIPNVVREELARWIALTLIGLIVWAMHWWFATRGMNNDQHERTTILRRLYLYAVMAAAVLFFSTAAAQFMHAVIFLVLRLDDPVRAVGNPARLTDLLESVPFAFVASIAWIYHWREVRRDRLIGGEQGGSATLRRWYVYGIAFLGLLTLLVAESYLIDNLWKTLARQIPVHDRIPVVAPIPTVLIGLLLWYAHWHVLAARDAEGDDRRSVLRSVYLFAVLATVVTGTIIGASQLLYYALARVLGVESPGGVSGSLLLAASGPASILIVYGVGWLYQRMVIRQQTDIAESTRQVGVQRFYTYLVSLVSIYAFAVGVAGILWIIADAVTRPSYTQVGGWWQEQISLFVTLIIVAMPTWLGHWRSKRALHPDEVRSLARRLYTYLTLIGGSLALIGAAATVLYRVLLLVLGSTSIAAVTNGLARAIAVAIVAGAIAVYHWRVIRDDSRLAATIAPHADEAVDEPAIPPHERVVRLRARSSAELEEALADLARQGIVVTAEPGGTE